MANDIMANTNQIEEDQELRELLISNLESRGVLSKIKADLRAAIFQCLDSRSTNELLSGQDAQLPLSLCADLLEKFGLFSTNKVFQTECGSVAQTSILSREELKSRLGIEPEGEKKPLVNYLIENKQTNKSQQLIDIKSRARTEFNHYDHEKLDKIHLQDAASALLDLFPSVSETQAEFLFSDLKYKNQVSFEEWFKIVENFYQMCNQVQSGSIMNNKELSGLDFELEKLDLSKTEQENRESEILSNLNQQNEQLIAQSGEVTSRTNYTTEYSEFDSRGDDLEITEGRLPDSESDISTENFTFSKPTNQNQELTEDCSLRSDINVNADYIENV
jgi:hypothetical protein